VNTNQTNFRTYSHNKGGKWWMLDIATWSALQMLYIVEFANWDSQTTLGTGYSGQSAVAAGGATDAAAYHTCKISGDHNQYRWVEDPFSNCLDRIDGYLGSTGNTYVGTTNASFNGSQSALTVTGIKLPSSGAIRGFGYSEYAAWAFIPDTASGTDYTTYVCDRVNSSSSVYPAYVGGYYSSSAYYGLFYFYGNGSATSTNAFLGSRLLYIP